MVTVTELNRAPDGRFESLEADVVNTADTTTATENDVLKKAASGNNLKLEPVQTEPNVPNWEEDANSPLVGSGSQSHTITLSGTYDQIILVPRLITSTNSQQLQMRINGVSTSDYFYSSSDGSTTSGDASFELSSSVGLDRNAPSKISIQGKSVDGDFITVWGPTGNGNTTGLVHGSVSGLSTGTTTNSITLRGDSDNIKVDVSVFGWSQS